VFFELFLGRKIMKKYLFVVAILVMIVAASGCTFNSGNDTSSVTTKNYNANGISFDYPDMWNLTAQNATGIDAAMVTLSDTDFNKTNGTSGNYAVILKVPKGTLNIGDLKTQLLSSAKQVGGTGTDSSVTIDGVTANKTTYTAKNGTDQAQVQIISYEKNSSIIMLMYITAKLDPAAQQKYFDVITNSFKTT
jgi:hypothetical protein